MTNQPLVSIIIPTFNRAHLIAETLDSVLTQTYTNWECIVVDDGSTDHTDEVIENYIKNDKRFKFYHRPVEHLPGGNGARNYGFKMSKGEYVNWLDSDDLIAINKIERQINILHNTKETITTCAWARFTNPNVFSLKQLEIFKDYKPATDIFKDYGEKGFFFPHVFLCSRSLILKAGLWNENLIINQDGEFFCRVLLNAKRIAFTTNTYVLYRESSNIKVSTFSSIEKVRCSIKSWKLIIKHFENKNMQFDNYVNHAKKYIYKNVKLNYPKLIPEYKLFFKNEIKYDSFSYRLNTKIYDFFK